MMVQKTNIWYSLLIFYMILMSFQKEINLGKQIIDYVSLFRTFLVIPTLWYLIWTFYEGIVMIVKNEIGAEGKMLMSRFENFIKTWTNGAKLNQNWRLF